MGRVVASCGVLGLGAWRHGRERTQPVSGGAGGAPPSRCGPGRQRQKQQQQLAEGMDEGQVTEEGGG